DLRERVGSDRPLVQAQVGERTGKVILGAEADEEGKVVTEVEGRAVARLAGRGQFSVDVESQVPAPTDGGQVRPRPADVALVADDLARLNGIDPAHRVIHLGVEGAGLAGASAAEQPTPKRGETRQAQPRAVVVYRRSPAWCGCY